MEWVEHLIAGYMKRYEANYEEAIDLMIEDLRRAKDNKELKADSIDDAEE